MYHLRKLKCMLLLMFAVITANAQLDDGKVYNFVNVGNSGQSMTFVNADRLSIASTDVNDYKQLWYAVKNSDGSFSLRSLKNGYYLRSRNAANNQSWTTVKEIDANCKFSSVAIENTTYYTLRATNTTSDQHSMHYGSGTGTIVCWYSTETASQWTFTEVGITSEQLAANWEYIEALESEDIYQTALDALFADKSCTTPKKSLTTEEAIKADADYQALSKELQKMVLKVYLDNWAEDNYDANKSGWDAAYAKKYRVQLYEPYNEPEAAASALGINAHTNLNNPTGIFSTGREAIYVMVGGDIEDGASLYLASYTGNGKLGGYADGIELHEGLNVISSSEAGNNYCINYVVHTFDTEGGTKKGNKAKVEDNRLANFPDLKIHIEGGSINGYWNKMGDELYLGSDGNQGDTADDWDYLEARATQTTVTVLGEYITLQFPLLDEHTVDTDGNTNKGLKSFFNDLVNVEDVIDEWDNVMMWERLLLGLLSEDITGDTSKNPKSPYSSASNAVLYTGNETDGFESGYSDYYNVHGLSYGIPNSYMYGSWDHCGYNFNTMGSIIGEICTSAGSHWGPGHEIGHQHQGIFNMRGLTEVTNNLFSNVVLWYFGETTSRVNGSEGSLSNVLAAYNTEGSDFFTNNIWAMTHMYYKMFLYYHVLGHNPKFYPRLFEMLRQDPMVIEYNQKGAESLLHFYKKCCYASGEDLTEFFRAYGFFRVMTDRFVGDYSNAVYNQTQAEIDAAIAEVKAWAEANEAKENIALLFINDATGETIESHKGDNLDFYGESVVCSEMGGYATFEQSITEGAELENTMSGQNVTVSAEGGVGYAIYNKDGEIIAFSDKQTFAISDECATALMWGETTMKVINADNTTTEVEAVDEVASKYALLGNLITEVEAELQYEDAASTKVGYYKDGALDALQTAFDDAKKVYDDQDVQSYTAAYAKLYEELYAVTHNAYNRVSLMSGGTYRLNSRSNTSYWMSVNGENKTIGEAANTTDTKQDWVFEATGTEDVYYIKNVNTSRYLAGATKNVQVTTTDTKAEAKGYKATMVEAGVWTLQCQDSKLQFLNRSGGTVLGWNEGNDTNSQWYITTVSVEQTAEKLYELQALVQKTKEIIDEMAVVTPMQKHTLQTTSSSSPLYLSTNACHNTLNNANDGQGLAGLLDEDVATYFHSDYRGAVNETHYLQVDLGEAHSFSDFIFYYTTRDNGNNCPTTIEVRGSNDGSSFSDPLYTFTGLPTEGGQTWESPILSAAEEYRYLRFMVTAAEGGHRYFVMSRFGISECKATVQSMGDKYVVQGLTSDALIAAYASIHSAQDKMKVGGATLDELTSLYEDLSGKYSALEDIYNEAKNAAFTAKKAELKALINDMTSLISSCGTVTYTPATLDGALALQTTNSEGNFYLSTNAQEPNEGPIKNLLTSENTYFHSKWSAAVGAFHHLEVDMGEGYSLKDFTFTYKTSNGLFPYIIKVYGSNDTNDTGTLLYTFSKDDDTNALPESASTSWTSSTISSDTRYRYIRFDVVGSGGGNLNPTPTGATSGTEYCFKMSYFGLTAIGTPESYTVELGNDAGGATEALMLAAYKQNQEAQGSYDVATTESQLQKAIDKLQADYDALENAKNSAQNYTVSVVGGNGNGGVVYNMVNYTDGQVFSGALSLTVGGLTAIPLDGYTAGVITLNGTTITVTYNKVYTVQVDGGDDTGGVIYDNNNYLNGSTITVLQDIDAAQLAAIAVSGYNAGVITVNHETKVITVTYTMTLPVILTTDIEAPVLYTIKSKRGDGKVLQYEPASDHLFSVADVSANSAKQAFFFMESDEAAQVYVYPFAAGEKVLAADDTGDGADRAFAKEKGTAAYEKWTFVKRTVDEATWYNLQPVGTSTYFSNYGGVSNKMGFYSSNPGGDHGSLFQFESTTVEGSGAYNSLKVYYDEATKGANIVGGDNPGYYPAVQAEAYNEAYASATALLNPQAITLSRRLTAEELSTSTVARTIAIKCVQESSYDKWVSKAAGLSSTLDADAVFSLEPADDGKAGTYYLKVVNQVDGYFQTSGYSLGAKSGAQDFVPVKAVYQGGSGNTAFVGNNADVSGNSDLGNLVRFVLGSSDGTMFLNPGFKAYNNGTGVWTVYNVYEVFYNWVPAYNDYLAAYQVLLAANNALVMNMPEVGKYYMIRSAHTGYAANKLIYATGDNTIRWDLDKTEENPEAVWTFTSEGYLENLNTGCAMNTGSAEAKLGDNPKTMSIKGISTDGQVLITPAGGTPLHADQWGHAVSWGTYEAGSASAWRIVEVEDMSLVNFTLKIGQYRHAGLYLNYAAEIPEGVEVYIAHTPDGEAGSIFADKLEGTVLPARTAVIIKGDEGEYSFKYTTDENTIDAERIAANLLGGSAYLKYQQVAEGGNLCCVFGQKGGEVGLYKNWVGYADVNGTAAEDTNGDGKVNEDGGTHFKVSANKIYYEYEPSAVAGASAFRFRFNNKEEGTTTIDELIFGGDSIIYNLYGQRIVKVAEPGIYIVNGKKIYVSDKMILNND